jgi:predicted GNAT family acetyltransferase
MTDKTPVTPRHNEGDARIEVVTEDGRVAGFSEYLIRDGDYVFFHTEVDPAFEGQGIGGQIASAVIEFVRDSGTKIVPRCPFILAYMRKHEETHDILAPGASLDPD